MGIRGHGRPGPRPKKQDPSVSDVVPEVVQTPALTPTATAVPKKRVRSAVNVAAEKKYYEKKLAEKKAAKEAEAIELRKPITEIWFKNRAALRESDSARYKEIDDSDTEIGDILWIVRNLEDGVKNGLQPGDGWRDEDFNPDGTFKDESKLTMYYPMDVLNDVRAARARYGDFNMPPLLALDDIRTWSDFPERRAKNKTFWDYGFLNAVPVDTEHRVLTAIANLMDRKDFFDRDLAQIAREFRPKVVLPDEVKVSCECGRASDVTLRRADLARLAEKGEKYRCGLCLKERSARLAEHNETMEFYRGVNQWGFAK